MDLRLNDKVVIVTGGTKGIGEGIVRSMAAEGANVVMVNRPGTQGPAIEQSWRQGPDGDLRPGRAHRRAGVQEGHRADEYPDPWAET
jgi:NAD(P)-dependent dehydrogenase (short-subunit alcohol dehydrogenase family)